MRARRTLLVALATALAAVAALLVPATASAANSRVVVRNCDGRDEVFYLDSGGQLWHSWEFTPGGGWSQAQSLGGTGRLIYGQIDVERNKSCALEVFGVGTNKQMYHIWQRTPGVGDWGPFYSLGGGFDGPPTVAKNGDGRLEVFGVGETGRMYHAWQTTPGGVWTGWYGIGQTRFRGAPYSPEDGVIPVSGGSLWVHAWGVDNCEYGNNQFSPGGAWYDEWTKLNPNC
jgi:hypothetical protein